MHLPTIAAIAERIERREVSPVQLFEECLDTIERLNPSLNAFITVTADSAMRQAQQAEAEIAQGHWRGPLHGIPVGLKDLIDTAGVRTTAASAVFRDRKPTEDAEVVKKLKFAGAVIMGKQNLHEFAYGGSSLISHFGPVLNPVNPDFIAGGSSGGSAAAVACGMCYAAVGTDTAGSIREPAALCGVVGLKPSYGLVSARGVTPLSVSLDHVGPITRTVRDSSIVLDAIAEAGGDYAASLGQRPGRMVLGIPRKHFFDDLDGAVASSMEQAMTAFRKLGFELRDVNVPVDNDRTLQMAQAFSYHRSMVAKSPELYDADTLGRIRSGESISDETYHAALGKLEVIRREVAEKFEGVDALVAPTTPILPPRLSVIRKDPARLRLTELILLRNTRPVNVWGVPAISVPCGSSADGLPIGLQIMGPPQGEKTVLSIASLFERHANHCPE
jgi:Asp-tRNA(Asn)/Glu-tRNA(Gln) amidotransferase A subunit family amidase